MKSKTKTLPYPGGKKRIASWIIEQMPPHHSYLEPYFGGGAVLFAKEPARIETINDLDSEVVNLYRVMREQTQELINQVVLTPYSREEYKIACVKDLDLLGIEQARRFLVRCMQSHGFRLSGDCGWKKDIHGRESAYALRHWNDLPATIEYIAMRLKSVQIENRSATSLIKAFNHSNVLIYADPPYVLSTRGRKSYKHEMTDEDHVELLEALLGHTGVVMLSGYDCELYRKYLSGWRKLEIKTRTHNSKRVECLWMNY